MLILFSIKLVFARYKLQLIAIFLTAAYLLTGFYLLKTDYIIADATIWMGLILLPYLFIIRQKGKHSYAYAIIALTFFALSLLLPMRSMYYFTIGFAVLFVLDSFIGKSNYLPLFLLIALSPVFKYLTIAFGFPIRMQLSKIAGNLISLMGYQAVVKGNIIEVNGYEFAVDAACVGLQMMITSFLIGLFILAYYERQTRKQLSFLYTLAVMACIAGLNIVCNLIRIVVLVLFKLLPGNPFHDIAGIVCLLMYVIIPLYFIIKGLFTVTKVTSISPEQASTPFFRYSLNALLFAGILGLAFGLEQGYKTTFSTATAPVQIAGYHSQALTHGVIKYEKENVLVYIKPIVNQYGIEHSPMVCWQGSGYVFKSINQRTVDGIEIYTGILTKDNEQIHAAWWFDNGKHQTINQLSWRWKVLQGEPEFSLVNINATSEHLLLCEVKQVLGKHALLSGK